MIALLVVLVVIVAIALGAIVVGVRQRHKVNQHLDRIANRVAGAVAPATKSPVAAVKRLEMALEAREAQARLRGGRASLRGRA